MLLFKIKKALLMVKDHLLDKLRKKRIGIEETIFCKDKTLKQIVNITKDLNKKNSTLFTKLKPELFKKIDSNYKKYFFYNAESEVAIYGKKPLIKKTPKIAIICAGTSDMPVVLEAKYTLLNYSENCEIFPDLGVAGLWRIQNNLKSILNYKIAIVVAGMDGALASVLGGLIPMPLIAVPSSTGYGTAYEGKTALNSMLTSCAPGVTVVNIDNGYGAACAAIRILNV